MLLDHTFFHYIGIKLCAKVYFTAVDNGFNK